MTDVDDDEIKLEDEINISNSILVNYRFLCVLIGTVLQFFKYLVWRVNLNVGMLVKGAGSARPLNSVKGRNVFVLCG